MSNFIFALNVTLLIIIFLLIIKSIRRFRIYSLVKRIIFHEIYTSINKGTYISDIDEKEIVNRINSELETRKLKKYVENMMIYWSVNSSLEIELFLNYLKKKHKFEFSVSKEEIDSMLSWI